MLNQNKSVYLIGAALGWGAQLHETELGPEAYYQAHLTVKNGEWHKMIYPTQRQTETPTLTYQERLEQIVEFNQKLASSVQQKTQSNQFCAVLGGDHSMAVGTWSGVVSALKAAQQFGLLWIDAHLDSHTPQTTPSQAIHGMPLAALLGYGEPALVNLVDQQKKLSPNYVVLFGIRSYEEGEQALLSSLNVRIYYMEEIHQRGVAVCFQEAIQLINQAPKGFGISLDLDAFDPTEAPGVGSPEPDGLLPNELLPELQKAFEHPNFKAFEIAEYNPTRDKDQQTLKLTQKILALL